VLSGLSLPVMSTGCTSGIFTGSMAFTMNRPARLSLDI
jgi:hypothetical protein